MDLESFWSAVVKLIDLCVPSRDLIAALPFEGETPMVFRTTIAGDPDVYWSRIIASEPPLTALISTSPGLRLADLDEDMGEEELMRTKFWKDIMEPDGWRHSVGLMVWDGDRFLGHLGINRTAEQGRFTDAEKSLLLGVQEHLDVAMKRVAAFCSELSLRKMLEDCLDDPLEGIAIFDIHGRMLHGSSAALRACARWNGGTGEQAAANPPAELSEAAREMLAGLLQAMQGHPRPPAVPDREVSHPEKPGLSARLKVMAPAKRPRLPCVVATFSRPSASAADLPVHRLTRGERRVAMLVADGLRNEDVARELSLSVNTVRAHLREVFAKLGIRHRGEVRRAFAPSAARDDDGAAPAC